MTQAAPPRDGLTRIVRIMDLAADDATLAACDHAHSVGQTPPEVIAAQVRHGIAELQIYRAGHRLVMVMDVTDAFDPAGLDAEGTVNEAIRAWHIRMAQLQRAPFADNQAWPEAHRVFRQSDHIKDSE